MRSRNGIFFGLSVIASTATFFSWPSIPATAESYVIPLSNSSACGNSKAAGVPVCSATTPRVAITKLLNLGQELLRRGDLHDVGFLEELIGQNLQARLSYDLFQDRTRYVEHPMSPSALDAARKRSTDRILTEIHLRPPQSVNPARSSFGVELTIYVVPKIGAPRPVAAEVNISTDWLGACPSQDDLTDWMTSENKVHSSNAPFPPPVIEGASGAPAPEIRVLEVDLPSEIDLSAALAITETTFRRRLRNGDAGTRCDLTLSLQQTLPQY